MNPKYLRAMVKNMNKKRCFEKGVNKWKNIYLNRIYSLNYWKS